jgi:hypothetical protein
MKSPTAVTHDDMTDLPINLKYWFPDKKFSGSYQVEIGSVPFICEQPECSLHIH